MRKNGIKEQFFSSIVYFQWGKGIVVFFVAMLFLASWSKESKAATYTWIGSSGAAWTTPASWSPNLIAPSASDTMVINASPANITGVPGVTIAALNINAANVTLIPGTATTLTVSNDLAVSASDSLTIGTDLIVAVGGTFSNSGILFGPGTLAFNLDNNIPSGSGSGGTFSNIIPLSLTENSSILTMTAPLTITDLILPNDFGVDVGANDLTVQGSITCTSLASITGTGNVIMTGTSKTLFGNGGPTSFVAPLVIAGTISVTGSMVVTNLAIDTISALTINSGITLDIYGTFSNSATNGIIGPGTLRLSFSDNIPAGSGSGGTFSSTTPVNLTVVYLNNPVPTVTLTAPITVANLTVNTSATLNMDTNNITIQGNLSCSGTGQIISGAILIMNGPSATISGNGNTNAIPVVELNASASIISNTQVLSLTLNSGTLSINNGDTLTISGDFTDNSLLVGPGTINYTGGPSPTDIPKGSGTFSSATPVNLVGNATSLELTASITVNNLDIQTGSFVLDTNNINVKGNLSYSGVIIPVIGVITMSGPAATINGTGSAIPVVIGGNISVTGNTSITSLKINPSSSFEIDNGNTCTISGPFANSGTITGPGTIQFDAANNIPAGGGASGTFSSITPLNLIANANLTATAPLTFKNIGIGSTDSINIGSNNLTLIGDATLNGYIYGTGSTSFSGNTGQKIFGNDGTISNLVINNPAGVTLDPTNLNITTSLNFVNGNLNTDTDEVLTNYISSITSSTGTGWINGTLELNGIPISGDASMRFEVGGATWYDPVDLDLHGLIPPAFHLHSSTAASGSFRALTFAGAVAKNEINLSPLDTAKSVTRTWTISNIGNTFTDFDLTLSYNTGEIPLAATQSQFVIAQTDDGGSHWTLDAGSTTGSGTQSVGLIYNSDFIVGQVDCNKLLSSVSTSVVNVSAFGGSNGAITITTNKGYGPFKYQWSATDSTFSRNDTSVAINNLTAGTYTITVTSHAAGCAGTYVDTVHQPNPVQVTETGKENIIYVFPNPAHDKLNIEFKGGNNADHLITFYDITGREVSKQLVAAASEMIDLDIKMLSKGFYIVRFDSAEMTGQVRVLVE